MINSRNLIYTNILDLTVKRMILYISLEILVASFGSEVILASLKRLVVNQICTH